MAVVFSFFGVEAGYGHPILPETRVRIKAMQEAGKLWSPLYNGALALNPLGNQWDSLQRSGLLCLYGMTERCADVKRSQGPTGQFWRGVRHVEASVENSFSRDQFNGVMAYFVATNDEKRMERYTDFLNRTGKLCLDGDSRCSPQVGSWGFLGQVRKHMGLATNFRMRFGKFFQPIGLFIGTRLTPQNYQLSLPAYRMLVDQAMGHWSPRQQAEARVLVRRAPFNPMLRYPAEGLTEKLAQLTLQACPLVKVLPEDRPDVTNPDEIFYDFLWSRRIIQKKDGKLYVVRDWVATKVIADGWDCILMAQILLHPFDRWGKWRGRTLAKANEEEET